MEFIESLPISLEFLSWMFAAGVAASAGALAATLGTMIAQVWTSVKRKKQIAYLMEEKEKKEFDLERELAGGTNWRLVEMGMALIGMLSGILFLNNIMYATFAAALGFGLSLFLARNAARSNKWKVRLEERDFISSLRLSLAMKPTVTLALERTADKMGEGLFATRLSHHVETKLLTEGPLGIIEKLTEEFQSKALSGLLVRLEAAKRGGLPLPQALEEAAEEIELELRRDAEFAVEDAPTSLTFPMLVTLFPPLIIMLVFPLVIKLMKSLREIGH